MNVLCGDRFLQFLWAAMPIEWRAKIAAGRVRDLPGLEEAGGCEYLEWLRLQVLADEAICQSPQHTH